MNCGDCILLRAALRNRRNRLLFANHIRAFRAFSRSKNLTAVYAYSKAQETQFYRKSQPEPQPIFRRCFFRKTKKISDGVLSVLRAKFDAVFGKLSPNLKSFFGDVFSQDKASKPPLYMHTARRKKRSFTGNSARTSAHFSVMFFRKTRKISDGVLSVLRAKFDAVFGKLSPNLKSFFGDVFSQDKASKPPLYMHTARRKKRSIAEKQPEKSDFHNVGFFFLCHIVNFFNVFVGYLLNLVLTVVKLVFGYSFIFVELF